MQRCDDQVDEQAVKYFVGHGDNKILTSDLAIILIDQVSQNHIQRFVDQSNSERTNTF